MNTFIHEKHLNETIRLFYTYALGIKLFDTRQQVGT